MIIHRRQKIEKIYKNLSKLNTEMKFIQKTSSEADFYQFWLDFGSPRRPQNLEKWQKKQAEQIAKNRRQKNTKKHKKWLGAMGLAECAGRWGGYGGGKKTSKRAQINAKHWKRKWKEKNEGMKAWRWRKEVEETKKNWQAPATDLACRTGGDGSLRAFRWAVLRRPVYH